MTFIGLQQQFKLLSAAVDRNPSCWSISRREHAYPRWFPPPLQGSVCVSTRNPGFHPWALFRRPFRAEDFPARWRSGLGLDSHRQAELAGGTRELSWCQHAIW